MVKVPKERNEGAKLEVRGITFAEMIRSEVRVERWIKRGWDPSSKEVAPVFCFREVDVGIGKLDEEFDVVFLTEGWWGKVVVEVVGMYSAFWRLRAIDVGIICGSFSDINLGVVDTV